MPPSDPQDRVSLSRSVGALTDNSWTPTASGTAVMVRLAMPIVLVLALMAPIVTNILGLPANPMWVVGIVIGLIAVPWFIWWSIGAIKREWRLPTIRAYPDRSARVRAACFEEQADHVRAVDHAIDASFDPLILRIWLGFNYGREVSPLWGVIYCTLLGAFVLMSKVTTGLWWPPHSGFLIVMSALVVTQLSIAFIFPVYVRIVPGRADVFRYYPLRPTPDVITHDLRRMTVQVDYRGNVVVLSVPANAETMAQRKASGDPDPIAFWAGLGPVGRERLDTVLRAALTETPTPPVSDTELNG